jgi:hypothetical protein
MQKRTPYIRYTSRDFTTIKNDLINYAKKYYPNTHQDFNEGSFGSLMIDTVAYVGDIMSYYLDYQANESFIDTAIEYDNLLKLGAGLGYRPKTSITATGVVTMYVSVPANAGGTDIDSTYLPVIGRGTKFQSVDGNIYTLLDDVPITKDNAEIRKSRISDNAPFQYTAKVYGKVNSGYEETVDYSVGSFEKFKKILIGDNTISEIMSVIDSDGNVYYEVDYLTQNIIYRAIPNGDSSTVSDTPSIMKPFSVVRRFIVIREKDSTYIQFGGAADSISIAQNNKKIDPASLVINAYGKDYTTDESFDPSILMTNDKLGIAPVNTIISVTYRKNDTLVASVPSNSISRVLSPVISFSNSQTLDTSTRLTIANSLTVTNEAPIVGQSDDFTADELKTKIYGTFAAQNRAVTQSDYKALCYNMPGKYGSIKRVSVLRDTDELKRNINLYVISQDSEGFLVTTNQYTKNNLKNWLEKSKIINDTIDILDAKIVNFGIYFTAISDKKYNKYDILSNALNYLIDEFYLKMDIGESIQIARIYEALRKVDGLLDVRTVTITQKFKSTNQVYSQYTYNFDENMTADGMFLKVPKNVIMEIKLPKIDIEGKII